MNYQVGHIEIKLDQIMQEKNINKYRLSHMADMNWKQVDNYCNNNITRLDVYVLCKLCYVLDCKIEDLLIYIPPNN